jgi:hypothetical protein
MAGTGEMPVQEGAKCSTTIEQNRAKCSLIGLRKAANGRL